MSRCPQISVVIPTYNRRAFLGQAVDSVLEQSVGDLELIVVDDGSTDRTQQLLQRIKDPRLTTLRQLRQGVSAARNAGLKRARAPWIAFLDSDDRWQPEKLERQMDVLLRQPEYRACYTDEIWIRRGRRVNPRKRHRKYGGWIYEKCLRLCIVSPSSILLQRSLLEELGGFDPMLPVCEDYDLWLRLSCRRPVLFLDERLIVKQGGHPDQLSQSRWGLDRYRLQALVRMLRSGRLTPLQQRWTRREIVYKAGILETGCRNRGKLKDADRYRRVAEEFGV